MHVGTDYLITSFDARPIGGGSCGNLRDATIVVSSMGMCASYAWSNQKTGFCIVGGQCFTSNSTETNSVDDAFQEAFDAAEQVPCNATGAMACYTFGSQMQVRRSRSRSTAVTHLTGTQRRQTLMPVVSSPLFLAWNCSWEYGLYVWTEYRLLCMTIVEQCWCMRSIVLFTCVNEQCADGRRLPGWAQRLQERGWTRWPCMGQCLGRGNQLYDTVHVDTWTWIHVHLCVNIYMWREVGRDDLVWDSDLAEVTNIVKQNFITVHVGTWTYMYVHVCVNIYMYTHMYVCPRLKYLVFHWVCECVTTVLSCTIVGWKELEQIFQDPRDVIVDLYCIHALHLLHVFQKHAALNICHN